MCHNGLSSSMDYSNRMTGLYGIKLPAGAGARSAAMQRADAGADVPDEPTARRFGNGGTVVYIGTLKRSSSGELRLRQVRGEFWGKTLSTKTPSIALAPL